MKKIPAAKYAPNDTMYTLKNNSWYYFIPKESVLISSYYSAVYRLPFISPIFYTNIIKNEASEFLVKNKWEFGAEFIILPGGKFIRSNLGYSVFSRSNLFEVYEIVKE